MSDASAGDALRRRAPDPEAMLVALVLAPATYSRNRFFDLYRDPSVRAIRGRASLVRSIIRQLTRRDEKARAEIRHVLVSEDGRRIELTYVVAALGLRRTAILDPLELALIRFAASRSPAAPAGLEASPTGERELGQLASPSQASLDGGDARGLIESVLARLAP